MPWLIGYLASLPKLPIPLAVTSWLVRRVPASDSPGSCAIRGVGCFAKCSVVDMDRLFGVQNCTATELSHQVQYHESDWTCENLRNGRAHMIEMTGGTVETTDLAKWWETPAWDSSSCGATCRAIHVLESSFRTLKNTLKTRSLFGGV